MLIFFAKPTVIKLLYVTFSWCILNEVEFTNDKTKAEDTKSVQWSADA